MPRPTISRVLEAIADLRRRFDGVDQHLNDHDAHFTRLDRAVLKVDGKVDAMGERQG